jgi:hypothetical protein
MQSQTTIRCSNCGQPYAAVVRNVVDVAKDPQGKALLLAGQLNTSQCPNCGTVNALSVPLMYHDASKELLVALVPMELNMNKDQQERVVGDLMKALPKENFKGYMFNPKRALTMQGLMELVLQADGVTPEMMEEQRKRVSLIQDLVEASDEDLVKLITENDSKIDMQFFQTMGMMAQRLAQSGRPDVAERILQTQQVLLQFSTLGKELVEQQAKQEEVVEEVAREVQALGAQAQRSDFLALARKYMDDGQRLQALVGLVRPVFDAQFFQELTVAIGQEAASERPKLEALRDTLTQLTEIIDQQSQMQVQQAVSMLQAMLNMPLEALDDTLRDNLPLINDTFMAVLTANIQEAERRQDTASATRLRQIYERVVAILQENMQPELVFVNQLLSAQSDAEAQAMLQQGVEQFGDSVLDVMDAIGEVLNAQGEFETLQRLAELRENAEAALKA